MKTADSFWRRLSSSLWGRLAASSHVGGPSFFRPRLERLEARITPSGNDTLKTALAVTLENGTAVPSSAALVDPNQADLYVVQLQAGDQVVADLSAVNGAGNPGDALRVFDGTGKQLAFQENPVGGGDTSLTFDALATGPYYVGVSSNGDYAYDPTVSGGGTGGLADGAYTLNLTLTAGAILATENAPNYTIGTAQQISGDVDSSITGQSVLQGTYTVGKTEYYQFTADQTGGLTAAVTPGDGTAFLPRIALYGSSGQLLIQSDASPGNVSAQLNQNLQPGTYYLGVSAVADSGVPSGDQSYTLATTFVAAQPSFQPLPVGPLPQGEATGDFNHDGNLDIVTANYDNTVSVLLGNGDGTFQPAEPYTVVNSPYTVNTVAVAVGDFNHDGNLDLVTANSDGTVSVLLGNGDGTFQPAQEFPVGNSPNSLAVGDFNHDGNLDVVTGSNYGPNSVSVLLGNGDGTFAPAQTFAVGGVYGTTHLAATGDFNNDGNLDLVTISLPDIFVSDELVSVLLGNGDGTFRPGATYAGIFGSGYDSDAVVGDFNHDGNLDLVTANHNFDLLTAGGSVSVLLGNGDGTFEAPKTFPTGAGTNSVAAGDFNHDGNLDLVTVNSDGSVSVLLGDGDGAFAQL